MGNTAGFCCGSLLFRGDGDCESSAGSRLEVEFGFGGYLLAGDGVGLRIGEIMCIGRVGVDYSLIFATLVEEIESRMIRN